MPLPPCCSLRPSGQAQVPSFLFTGGAYGRRALRHASLMARLPPLERAKRVPIGPIAITRLFICRYEDHRGSEVSAIKADPVILAGQDVRPGCWWGASLDRRGTAELKEAKELPRD